MRPSITFEDIAKARSVIADQVHRTPVLSAVSLGRMAGCELLLKAENLQRAGSFKVRGAVNKMAGLSPAQKAGGVIAASAGNHAQGVALAAGNLGIDCTIVMPRDASIPKVEATRGYGANVVLHGEDFDQAMRHARRLIRENGLTLVHAFDDPAIIAGQGTIGLELLEQAPDLDVLVVPVGGGGLIAGIGLAVREAMPGRPGDRSPGQGVCGVCRVVQDRQAYQRERGVYRGRRDSRWHSWAADAAPGGALCGRYGDG